MSAEFWVVTCYFNPCRYRSRRENFDLFMAGMEKVGANVLVAELAVGDEDFELPESDRVLRLRSNSILWHKERLLNIAVESLPADCRKVGWFDNDILFDDPRWLERTADALDRAMVVQPFSSCNWLKRGETSFPASGVTYESFAHCFSRAPSQARSLGFHRHGHTGFAWAARRELFETCGLYEVCLSGNGDHLMAHAFAGGMVHSPCLMPLVGDKTPYARHFWRWAVRARDLVDDASAMSPGAYCTCGMGRSRTAATTRTSGSYWPPTLIPIVISGAGPRACTNGATTHRKACASGRRRISAIAVKMATRPKRKPSCSPRCPATRPHRLPLCRTLRLS